MLLERMGETVTLVGADGTETEVAHVLVYESSDSDQTVLDVQTRFINQARYKGDNKTVTVLWPKGAPTDLMDAHLVIRGETYEVYGAPLGPSGAPTGYAMRVTATRSLYLYDIELLTPVRTRDEWGVWHDGEPEATPTKANLMRLSDTAEHIGGQTDLARVTLFELPPGTWDPRYTAFRYGGDTFRIESHDTARDSTVIGGTREAVA